MLSELSNRIWSRKEFQREYVEFLRAAAASELAKDSAVASTDRSVLRRLLASAGHFACSEHEAHRDAAYRIATSATRLFGDEYDGIADVAAMVLVRLGNFPTASFLCGGFDGDALSHWPTSLWLEASSHRMRNTRAITSERTVVFTDFQREVWDALETQRAVAVSAPTSAGKTYVLQQYLIAQLVENPKRWFLYIAPTRALIQQVADGLGDELRAAQVGDVRVTNVPIAPERLGAEGGVYVLTPERLELLRRAAPLLQFAGAIVDEAQTVANDARGILLQGVMQDLVETNVPKMLFAAPFAARPEALAGVMGVREVVPVRTEDSPVAQTWLYLDSAEHDPGLVTVAASLQNERVELGTRQIQFGMADPEQKLAVLSWEFGRNEKNIVYANGPAKCERIAQLLADAVEQDANKSKLDPEVLAQREEFAKFIEEHIHPKYLLGHVLRHGIAFHYGNMPSIVRSTIETFFARGLLDYVVCTSTLLYGVNLPARNIFLLTPESGSDTPISSSDFWNLVGRAGRLGKDVVGRVYLIDSAQWLNEDELSKRTHDPMPAFKHTLLDEHEALLSFMEDHEHPSGKHKQLEAAFGQLCFAHRHGRLDAALASEGLDTGRAARLRSALMAATEKITVPAQILDKNRGISPFRQQEMFDALLKVVREGAPEAIVPPHPQGSKIYGRLLAMFALMELHFEKKQTRSPTYFARLAIAWMRGEPIRQMIEKAIKRRAKELTRGTPKVATVVRKIFDNIEQDLRFRHVKYARCYLDLAEGVLEQCGEQGLIPRLPAIPLYLELGASSKTMMSFISLGLSRTTASLLARKCINTELEQDGAAAWIRRQDLELLEVPGIAIGEVRRALG